LGLIGAALGVGGDVFRLEAIERGGEGLLMMGGLRLCSGGEGEGQRGAGRGGVRGVGVMGWL
jgi:hypothetical protein